MPLKKKKKKKLLIFLCTGNTCRSPMAAGYLKKILTENKIRNIEIKTAGVMTVAGLLATPEAVQIMEAVGVDLRKHRSSKLTEELIKRANLILGMTPFHVQSALRMSPEARSKTLLLKEYTGSDVRYSQIADPMGCTLEVYKKVFNDIKSACNKLLKTEFIAGKKRTPKTKSKKIAAKKTAAISKNATSKKKSASVKAPAKKTMKTDKGKPGDKTKKSAKTAKTTKAAKTTKKSPAKSAKKNSTKSKK